MGPYETEQQAAAYMDEAYHYEDRMPGSGSMSAYNLGALTTACEEYTRLGDYDRQVIEWLSGQEPTAVAVLIGIVRRAYWKGRHDG